MNDIDNVEWRIWMRMTNEDEEWRMMQDDWWIIMMLNAEWGCCKIWMIKTRGVMIERWLNNEWGMMDDERWIVSDERRMMSDERWMMTDEWWRESMIRIMIFWVALITRMTTEWWIMNDDDSEKWD